MNFLVWLILVSSVHSSPQGRRRESNRSPSSRNRIKELSDEDILKALSILMSETEKDRPRTKSSRRGRQEFKFTPVNDEEFEFTPVNDEEFEFTPVDDEEFEFTPVDDDIPFDEMQFEDEGFEESDRQSVRGFSGPPFSRQESCEVTGFETRLREECEEVFDTECRPIMVKKFRTEIYEKCETMLDKICNVTYSPVPKQKCSPTTTKRCILFK